MFEIIAQRFERPDGDIAMTMRRLDVLERREHEPLRPIVTVLKLPRKKPAENFRHIIARALELEGSYYLTYHHWATRQQTEAAYPQFVEFLKLKRKYDPEQRFQSDWYRFYTKMFADALR